ncbi:methylated-DNA--[protein]-cysteine S-methyltransferase [Agrobacterium rubi]|uniref:methylated-DNA--[protein]-cysteine S-methyltransferase n=1 Tax=Agrobacterium rubi TaxID=28099 RepID=A0AAE7R6P5_9HYPH|nr:bifunctional helix-turn-helix domain-containing protein/methylated-DNA--[protein]-cysteine S-methyltransferase [Agrobacterium rubi]NTE89169.1 methylated-DNA--[protein]-cysteine S-methyltransferase [Agrobacterium rubi]NTF04951.1 methylated-DNA--[protein]-cysteine S-methyltransferase [Agrobacterium rubi]NTF38721.1 methylated-DNA--[protein]-cysteine S-methyltransferase [Agrobacterium rubi]OCJ43233.1 6-O-methylguanine DNA methyltransferase [Agrobacterium rubi]QTF99946.1 methylated-DNA--[protein
MNANITLKEDITPVGSDYETVRKVIEILTVEYRDQPSLETIATQLGQSPTQLQKTFTRWAGLSPKAFLQAVTLDHAKRLLRDESLPLLDAALEVGMSGPSRLHDLFVTHEAMSPGEWKAKGGGLLIRYGFHPSPFGLALIMITDRGLAGCAFADPGEEKACFEDMSPRWPNADYIEDSAATAPYASRIFDADKWKSEQPLRVVLLGTDFQVRVWQSLLKIPLGKAVTYSHVAQDIGQPTASRAVGAAIGANPISFVVPCHRAVGKSGALTGYHWGLTRKRAMLGWETGKV